MITYFVELVDEAWRHPHIFFLIEIGMLRITIWTKCFPNHCEQTKYQKKNKREIM